MILVIGGTSEGRAIARELAALGAAALVSAATGYGSELAAGDGVPVVQGRLNHTELAGLMAANSVRVLVDASHPFAVEISANAVRACASTGVKYIRCARPFEEAPDSPLVEKVESFRDAARRACDLGDTIFLATGSKTARIFYDPARREGKRVVIRVIPDPERIRDLLDMGFSPADVAALQGPFSEEMNVALLKHYRADVLVTKESGRAGGLDEKISAAVRLGIPVIIVRRPPEPAGAVWTVREAVETALTYLKQLNE
ncbi:MAG: precorrin-6A reductase [Peptococcaceae bacterium]|nr:precorrin-6A reductase [Peptococcaceae bacterium]